MMPIIFTILGVCIGIKFSKALKSGLYVGVGFVGLSVITALLTSSLGPALAKVVEIYGLELQVFDMGWPAAASVAYNTLVGSFISAYTPNQTSAKLYTTVLETPQFYIDLDFTGIPEAPVYQENEQTNYPNYNQSPMTENYNSVNPKLRNIIDSSKEFINKSIL